MTEAAIARRLGIPRHEVRAIIALALVKVARALNRGNREPVAPIGRRMPRPNLRRQVKHCSRCGASGHSVRTCGRAPKDGNEPGRSRRSRARRPA